jgi:hypothetical protein
VDLDKRISGPETEKQLSRAKGKEEDKLTTKNRGRHSRNQKPEYLAQRRKDAKAGKE